VRYDLKDHGGVIGFDDLFARFRGAGIDLAREAQRAGIAHTVWRLPFVYVYERKDMSVSLGGANIYPEMIRKALHNKLLHRYLTGKFVMMTENDRRQNQHLRIHMELKNGADRFPVQLRKFLLATLLKRLLKDNSEFSSVFYDQQQGRAIPRIAFWPYEHPKYFNAGGKQKWVKK